MQNSMPDKEIIDLFFQRNTNALKALEENYRNYCYTIACSILNNHEDSEECINDAWYKVWNLIPPNSPDNLKLYIAKITRNLAIDKLRFNKAYKRPEGTVCDVLSELENCVSSYTNNVEDDLLYKELKDTINKFVLKLPKKQGDIFIRRYFFCETISEIASKYCINENSVTSALTRARTKLKKHLVKEGFIC